MSEPRIPTSPRVALEPREETTCSRCGTRCLDYRSPGPVCIGCVDEDRRAAEAQVARLAEVERERDEALRLAYMGEHRFPENSWRHRCEEVVPILREAQAESARLRAAVEDLAGCVRHYRDMYQRHGGDALDTGRAWDLMRRAEHAAVAALAGEAPEPTTIPVDVDLLGVQPISTDPEPADQGDTGSWRFMRFLIAGGQPIHIRLPGGREFKVVVSSRAGAALAGEGEVLDRAHAERGK